jgi:large subunit ribosomal protein L14
MIQLGTIVKVVDNSGIVFGQCIKVLNTSKSRLAYCGDMILISVKWISKRRFKFIKSRLQKRNSRGTIHRAMLIRQLFPYKRSQGIFTTFNENSVILVNRLLVPLSNRVWGPILKELCIRTPSLGCLIRNTI